MIFLTTNRLTLQSPSLFHLTEIFLLRSDPDVMKYIGDGSLHTKDQVEMFLKENIDYYQKYGTAFFSVFEKESSEFVGQAGLFHLGFDETQSRIEIAYRLHKKFWGRGYATELTKALIRWGFDHLEINKLVAVTHPKNIASQKVLIKSGFDERGEINWHTVSFKLPYFEIYKADCIEIVPYNSRWPEMAESEIKKLRDVLPSSEIIDIQHVGSTAIPGMSAKPIVDIQIAVDSLDAIKSIAIDILEKLNYQYWDKNPDKTRMFFVKGMPPFGEKRTHHVHIVELDSKHWKDKLFFRDYLRLHPSAVREYEDLKLNLAKEYKYDRERYTEAKTNFIRDILK